MMLHKSSMVVTDCPGALLPQGYWFQSLAKITRNPVIRNQNILDLVENVLYETLAKPDPCTRGEGLESSLYTDLFHCNHECSTNQIVE